MERRINIILTALALLGGCNTDDRMQESITVTVGVSRPDDDSVTKAGASVRDNDVDNLAFLIFNDADGTCVWNDILDGEVTATVTLPGGKGRSYTAVALANFEDLDGCDNDGWFQWSSLGSLDYNELRSLSFDAVDIRSTISDCSVIPMYGERQFTGSTDGSVTVPLLRMVDKLTIGTLETGGDLLAAGVTLDEVSFSFKDVPQVNVAGIPTELTSGDYDVSEDLLSDLTESNSFYFLAGSTAVFSFEVGGETLAYELTPEPPTGSQRGNIHYVLSRGVFSSSDLCWPEFVVTVADWNATLSIPEVI